ncbi:ABC transporter ATP-binding protein [Clostridia bacterium]|nr:ABC transporter ATP-binding protein [Clostridia bacterium]
MTGVKKRYVLSLFLTVSVSVSAIINPHIISYVVDNFIARDVAGAQSRSPGEVVPYLASYLLVHLTRMGLLYLSVVFTEQSSQQMIINIRRRLFANILDEEMSFFQRFRTGDLMTRFTGDLDMCRHSVSYIMRVLVENILIFLAAFTYLSIVNWRMTLTVVAIMPLIIVVRTLFAKRARPLYTALRERLSLLNTTVQENIEGNRVVRAFAKEDYEIEKFTEKNQEYRGMNLEVNQLWLKFWPVIEIISQSLNVTVALVGGLFAVNKLITIGQLASFMMLSWALSNPMRTFGVIFNDIERFFTSANKVIELFYSKPSVSTRPEAAAPDGETKGEITFRGVTFGYDKKIPVLKDIDLHIAAGETVAIMGSTGSGKTTLLNLIPRFYDVQSGSVLIDGKDVRDYPIPDLRKKIGIATQDVFLFSDTVEGNVAYGDLDLPVEDVEKFAKMADAHEFIGKMADGYDTIIGERGVGLSGGQRQRIALARALAIKPRILILDDTTSAVDMETEKYIQEQLAKIDYTCTKIIVAQRISSVKDADKIVVLRDNAIAEIGTHEELLASDGYYREIFTMQSDGI